MKINSLLKSLLLGNTFPQEYLCLGSDQINGEMQVELQMDNGLQIDVSNKHLFVGYKPLIIAILSDQLLNNSGQVKLLLFQTVGGKRNVIGEIILKIFHRMDFYGQVIFLLEGVSAKHELLSTWHQLMNKGLYNYRADKKDNLYFDWNVYQQVRLAYVVPRTISLISLAEKNLFNLFPTDLHGQINESSYMISLRSKGKAFEQADRIKNLTLCNISAAKYNMVYSLGKRHMKDLSPFSELPFSDQVSDKYHFPLPLGTIEYRELELEKKIEHGVHQLLFFKCVNRKLLKNEAHLKHIHAWYAVWRSRNRLKTDYLIRD